jgi:hypothetical protein
LAQPLVKKDSFSSSCKTIFKAGLIIITSKNTLYTGFDTTVLGDNVNMIEILRSWEYSRLNVPLASLSSINKLV